MAGSPPENAPEGRVERTLVRVVYGLSAVVAGLALWLVVARLRSPVDAEWMTGAIRDGVARVRDGRPLYAEPTAHFVPFVYPPLYFWVAALFARVFPLATACKLVSIGATFVTAASVHRLTCALGAKERWQRLSLALFVATYPITLFFYDIERVDSLYAAMTLASVAMLVSRSSVRATAIAGALLGASFFAKQAGVFVFGAAVVGLWLATERKRAFIVAAAGAAVLVVLGAYLHVSTQGWFDFYCLKLPGGHGIRAARLSLFFVEDVPRTFAYAAGTIAFLVPVITAILRGRTSAARAPRDVLFGCVLLAGTVAAFFFRAHAGGWANVLIAWLPLACVAVAVSASRAEASSTGTTNAATVSVLLVAGVGLQLTAALFDPTEIAPNAEDAAERQRLVTFVQKLEAEGEVLVTTTGGITREPSAHAAAVEDIVRAGEPAPRDLREGIDARRFKTMLVGAPDEHDCARPTCAELVVAIARGYFVAGRRHERTHSGMAGYDGRPRWLLRPRQRPLPATLSRAELEERQRIEMALAMVQRARTPSDVEVEPNDAIEDLATRELDARAARQAP